jgi:hypothetical protein
LSGHDFSHAVRDQISTASAAEGVDAMSREQNHKNKRVLLKGIPPGFSDDLPQEDQEAISNVIGKSVLLVGYDKDGRAELEFTAGEGNFHTIYVDPKFIDAAKSERARQSPRPASDRGKRRKTS